MGDVQMATQHERIVRIEHPDTGHRYAVTEHAFKHAKIGAIGDQTYEDAGYKIVSYEDGTEYGGDNEPTKYAILPVQSEIGSEEAATNDTRATRRTTTRETVPDPSPDETAIASGVSR